MVINSFQEKLSLAKRGDSQAFEQLVAPYTRLLTHLTARLITPDTVGAALSGRDLGQETLLKAWECLHHFKGATEGEFCNWMRAICQTIAINTLRDQRAQLRDVRRLTPITAGAEPGGVPAETLAAPDSTPSQKYSKQEEVERVLNALDRLPDPQPEIIQSRYLHGLSFQEIADMLGYPLGSVTGHFYRGMEALRGILDPEDVAQERRGTS